MSTSATPAARPSAAPAPRGLPGATPEPGDPSGAFSPGYRRYALVVLLLVFTSSHVDRQILAILLESIKADLLLSDTQLGFLSGIAFALFYATLGIPIAMWADRSNRRNIIAWAIGVWSAMTAVCGLAVQFWQLALARVGVGIGEAGSSPPSHSMIADLYPPHERATAMGTFALGINLGILVGFLIGGWVNQIWGWRAAFFVVGLPGLALAVVVRVTLREPPRGLAERAAGTAVGDAPALGEVFACMWRTHSLRHLVIGNTLMAFVGYGAVLWLPAFLIRTHGMSSGEVGTLLALLIGIGGGIGTWLGGWASDRLGRRDARWSLWIVTAALLVSMPFTFGVYLSESSAVALTFFVIPAMTGAMNSGPSFALTQGLVDVRMRSVASAVLLFILNIIGLGLGPQSVGLLSDLLEPSFGVDSLRYAMLSLSLVGLWAALHYWQAGRHLPEDLARVSSGAQSDASD